ncbi:multidrug DMT transporter permease [Actinomadura sp. KC345]|uniref:EamA family transporter n=1 Tax=Actinomadura sp. KC345 TaxID=2530371 RepID=UPI0010497053|nr:EamA family transporter [Actinomadura sp. KC345]TDC57866.1 multidrug DMT transporter permease [Actinomadura sp. KC345]
MTGVSLALASALSYGVADVWGGLLSRRADFRAVALLGQAGGLVCAVAAALLVPAPGVTGADLGWGALSGVGTGAAMVFLYRGISNGNMSVVVPVSAVGGVALPVVAGVAFLGDRPSAPAWAGIAVVLPALWLVSRSRSEDHGRVRAALLNGLVASCGIGIQYLALAQAGGDAGLWPVAAGRVAAVLAIAPMAGSPQCRLPSGKTWLWSALNGALATVALVFYLLATREQLVVIAVVLSSLYPVVPVLLGVTALRERLSAAQAAGLAGAGVAVVLLTLTA